MWFNSGMPLLLLLLLLVLPPTVINTSACTLCLE
jgi:hypothetical protein